MNETSRPQLVQPRDIGRSRSRETLVDRVIDQNGFDVDVWHVMEQRDNALIADEVLNGAGSNKFVYSFDISGKNVSGVSVIGARHLASIYGGIKHRIVASTQKIGSLFVFKSYPSEHQRMHVQAETIMALADEPDFYEVLVEINDIKTGNTIQVEKREAAEEKTRAGGTFARPHYQLIAQSKAFRNGVLDIIPQDVVLKWKAQQLALGKSDIIVDGVRDEKLSGILQFASAKAIAVDRRLIEELTMDQISGLREAAKEGVPAFVNSAKALGIVTLAEEGEKPAEAKPSRGNARALPPAQKGNQGGAANMPESDPSDPGPSDIRAAAGRQGTAHDPNTGEIKDEGKSAPSAATAKKGGLF